MFAIENATFKTSLASPAQLEQLRLTEPELPQFAFIGRSNVGKSSFINSVTATKNLCRSGSTPGLTRTVNLFVINRKIHFADLPGYGYAKMSIPERKKLEQIIFWYLGDSGTTFKQIFLLVDSKIGPQPSDLEVLNFLNQKGLPTTIIATKIDRLRSSERSHAIKKITQAIPHHNIIPYSSENGEGRSKVLEILGQSLH
ncbi:ribosome biogenesis GTP-binding protein YsxC [Candidatus Peregrinibacteria bacterium]|nr:ribosome biogenesis GTP-binding protein YsxC [Candidatus Peregrinibacteria bacterium]